MDRLRAASGDRIVIPFARPLTQYLAHRAAIDAALRRALESGQYILGSEVAHFERSFAAYCGREFGIAVNSGTDALILALKALGVGHGDEVVTVSHTALATVAAVLAADAVPVLVDVDPEYYTLDPAQLLDAVTVRTKVILPVHLYGQSADMNAIMEFAQVRGLAVIEDCAQAAGGSFRGKPLGSFGYAACYSFFPTKNLGAIGDGGMVVTSDANLAEAVRRSRQYGWDDSRQTQAAGVNSRLDEIQAAVLSAKLPTLDAGNARRAAIAERYTTAFESLPLKAPAIRAGSCHAFHLYVVACEQRDGLRRHLAGAGIDAGIHYPRPVHRHGGYAERVRLASELPTTEMLADRVLSLPIYPELKDSDAARVIDAVREFFSSEGAHV